MPMQNGSLFLLGWLVGNNYRILLLDVNKCNQVRLLKILSLQKDLNVY